VESNIVAAASAGLNGHLSAQKFASICSSIEPYPSWLRCPIGKAIQSQEPLKGQVRSGCLSQDRVCCLDGRAGPAPQMTANGRARKWRDVRLKSAIRHITDIGETVPVNGCKAYPIFAAGVCSSFLAGWYAFGWAQRGGHCNLPGYTRYRLLPSATSVAVNDEQIAGKLVCRCPVARVVLLQKVGERRIIRASW